MAFFNVLNSLPGNFIDGNNIGNNLLLGQRNLLQPFSANPTLPATASNAGFWFNPENGTRVSKTGQYGLGPGGFYFSNSEGNELVHFKKMGIDFTNKDVVKELYNMLSVPYKDYLANQGITEDTVDPALWEKALSGNPEVTLGNNNLNNIGGWKPREIAALGLDAVGLGINAYLGYKNYQVARRGLLESQKQFQNSYNLMRNNYENQVQSYNSQVSELYRGRATTNQSRSIRDSIRSDAEREKIRRKLKTARVNEKTNTVEEYYDE